MGSPTRLSVCSNRNRRSLGGTKRPLQRRGRRRRRPSSVSVGALAMSVTAALLGRRSHTVAAFSVPLAAERALLPGRGGRPLCASVSVPDDASGRGRDTPHPLPSTQPRSYYDRIGRPRTVVAPMVAQSDLPFRLLCRRYGADLSYTQMIHAKNCVGGDYFRRNHLDVYPIGHVLDEDTWGGAQMNCIDGGGRCFGPGGWRSSGDGSPPCLPPTAYPDEGPVVVQLAGHDPDVVAEAAARIYDAAEGNLAGIDLNCGCPQTIARKGRYGAHLMEEDPGLVCEIVSRLRRHLPAEVGVSAKIRLPGDPSLLSSRIHGLVDSGADLLAVHGRTLRENKTRVNQADWDGIAEAVRRARERAADPSYPIVANGGIEYGSDVSRCLSHTGASAVMSSEALLENPALFAEMDEDAAAMTPAQIFARQMTLTEEYLDLAEIYPPVPGSLGKVGGSFNVVRSHAFKMLYRYLEEQTDLRARLADRDTVSLSSVRSVLEELRERCGSLTEDEWSERKSGQTTGTWYRRHRDASEEGRTHRRGAGVTSSNSDSAQTVEERKAEMRERIRLLKKEKERRRNRAETVAA